MFAIELSIALSSGVFSRCFESTVFSVFFQHVGEISFKSHILPEDVLKLIQILSLLSHRENGGTLGMGAP